jgi:hypothetical protein
MCEKIGKTDSFPRIEDYKKASSRSVTCLSNKNWGKAKDIPKNLQLNFMKPIEVK